MLRTSSYTIFVKLPDNNEDVLLVHRYTGTYNRVSRDVADFLRSREAKRAATPLYGKWSPEPEASAAKAVSDSIIDLLRDQGHLTELSLDEEETLFSRLAEKLHERALRQAPSYIFMPTYDCNLRCTYCYQDHMRADCSFKHLLHSMRRPIVDRIFDALPKIEQLHGLDPRAPRRRNLGFFGGKPLLAVNRPIVEYIVGKAFETGEADLWAVTNGIEIDAYRELLGPAGIARLQITLDGPHREHDKRRVYADGAGSYERIAANITMALELGVAVSVRLNVDCNNMGDLPAVADEIVARAWDRCPGFGAYTSPIRGGQRQDGRQENLELLGSRRGLDQDARRAPEPASAGPARRGHAGQGAADLRRQPGDPPQPAAELLQRPRPHVQLRSVRRHLYLLGADGRSQGQHRKVTPEGDVELRFDHLQIWRGRTVASNPVCRRCRFALHCGGGCAILALDQNGAFNSNYCDGFAARFKASLAEAYGEHISGAGPATVLERVCDL